MTNSIRYQVSGIKLGTSYFLLLASYFLLVFTSCHKSGTGGKAMFMVTPQHHGVAIINHVDYPDTVFLKYNTNELPGTKASDYDTYFIGKPRESEIDCDNMKWGKYYVYVVGYDSIFGARVTGGVPLNVKYSQRKSMVMVTVPVTE